MVSVPALSVRNGDNRRDISSPQLQGAFAASDAGTRTNRPLS